MTLETAAIDFSEIHRVAWLTWERDGCPKGVMAYWLAAERLVRANGPLPANDGPPSVIGRPARLKHETLRADKSHRRIDSVPVARTAQPDKTSNRKRNGTL